MFKLSIMSAALVVFWATSASACMVSYDTNAHIFASTCKKKQVVKVKTIGGGCYAKKALTFSLKPGESKRVPKLSAVCNGSTGSNVTYEWSDSPK